MHHWHVHRFSFIRFRFPFLSFTRYFKLFIHYILLILLLLAIIAKWLTLVTSNVEEFSGDDTKNLKTVRKWLVHVIADNVGHLGKITGERSTPTRMPDIGIFRLLSHGYQPLSHAFPLVFLPPSSTPPNSLTLLITKVSHFEIIVSSSSISRIEIREWTSQK